MIMSRLASVALRLGQLAFAAVVVGLTANYLHATRDIDNWHKKRFIYTEVVGAISILLALFWLLPFTGGFIHWPVDLILFVLWIVSFGLLIDFIGPMHCGKRYDYNDITGSGDCQRWKADVAFTFLSAMFWLASALLGLYYIRRHQPHNASAVADGVGNSNAGRKRNAWFRSSRV